MNIQSGMYGVKNINLEILKNLDLHTKLTHTLEPFRWNEKKINGG